MVIKTWEADKGKIKIGGIDFLCILNEFREIKLSDEHVRAQWFTRREVVDSKEIPVWLKEDVERAVRLVEDDPQSNL